MAMNRTQARACHVICVGDVDGPFRFRAAGSDGVARRKTAFGEVLVDGHAPLVQNVCRGLLPDQNDADDAFQATFLVLARKAGSICAGESLAELAMPRRLPNCRSCRHRIPPRRRQVEQHGAVLKAAHARVSPNSDRPGMDELAILFDELDRLPDRYRVPIVPRHSGAVDGCAVVAAIGLSRRDSLGRVLTSPGTTAVSVATARCLAVRGALATGTFPLVTPAAISSELLQTTVRTSLWYLSLDALAVGANSARALAWTERRRSAPCSHKDQGRSDDPLDHWSLATVGAGRSRTVSGKPLSQRAPAPNVTSRLSRTIRFPDDRAGDHLFAGYR